MADDGNMFAKQLLPVVSSSLILDDYVSACQVGITVGSLVLGAYSEATYGTKLSDWMVAQGHFDPLTSISVAAGIVLAVLTVLQLLFGELLPKAIALQFPTRVALFAITPIRAATWIFAPLIVILNGSGATVLKLFGVKRSEHHHVHSPKELEFLLKASSDEGLLKGSEHKSLTQALKLESKTVKEIMTRRSELTIIDSALSAKEILGIINASPFTRFPVYKDSQDNVIGILHAKVFIGAYIKNGSSLDLDALLEAPLIVPQTLRADQLIRRFQEKRTPLSLVFDEYGGLDGLVSLNDILSELFDEVSDDEKVAAEPEPLFEGGFRLPGQYHLDKLPDEINVHYDGNAVTVGGMVFEILGRRSVQGDIVTFGGWTFVVEAVDRNRVASVLATPDGEGA